MCQTDGLARIRTIKTETVDLPDSIRNQLGNSSYSVSQIQHLDDVFGRFTGEAVKGFLAKNQIKHVHCVASHGQTLLHEPAKGITCQVGNGEIIRDITNQLVVNNFRSLDVELGGQGAPLVPIGDLLLFDQYEACLNLGGFSNVSYNKNNERIAFDICPVNFVLNSLAMKLGQPFDRDGNIARSGNVDSTLLDCLNALS